VYFILNIFVNQFAAPNDGTVSPHALPAQRTSTLTPQLLVLPSLGELLFNSVDRRPPKAKALPLSLFFDGLRFDTPNKVTNSGAA
jgi:hypothetical protein